MNSMTLRTRNNTIIAVLVLCTVVTLSAIIGIMIVHTDSVPPDKLLPSIPPIVTAAAGCILGASIQYSFRKTLSAEITLFLVFITLVAFDALKPCMLLLQNYNKPITWYSTLTRLVYLVRFTGIFCFFSAGLFASGLPAQRLSITLGICFITAFTFSVILPLDSSIREDNFLFRIGMHRNMQTALIVLEVIAVINYIAAAVRKNEKTYISAAVGAAFALTGRELLFFNHSFITTTAGLLLFISGAVLYAKRIHRIYLWR